MLIMSQRFICEGHNLYITCLTFINHKFTPMKSNKPIPLHNLTCHKDQSNFLIIKLYKHGLHNTVNQTKQSHSREQKQ